MFNARFRRAFSFGRSAREKLPAVRWTASPDDRFLTDQDVHCTGIIPAARLGELSWWFLSWLLPKKNGPPQEMERAFFAQGLLAIVAIRERWHDGYPPATDLCGATSASTEIIH